MSGIPATTLHHLHELPTLPANTKIRTLGCIHSYNPTLAELHLFHPPDLSMLVTVDIRVPLPTLAFGELQDGEWFNVVGYVVEDRQTGRRSVQAVRVWREGKVRPGEWEGVVREMREVDEGVKRWDGGGEWGMGDEGMRG
ncbi:hypothetical protein EX30DRAFT_395060 [Ascodesmis nigricans]|uniref:CST complex subunit Ten1 n=1 Tax=Ascodesmis nigricans TaxID=341454 RepID=A0A4S2MZV3_9PEZI|nr:hypothetical protein EX30DRAFT_395060 [Ascodesmis nigricans]